MTLDDAIDRLAWRPRCEADCKPAKLKAVSQDLLVASDYLEDLGGGVACAQEARQRAAFWLLVARRRYYPDFSPAHEDTDEDNPYGERDWIRPSTSISLSRNEKRCTLTRDLYLALPLDGWGDTADDDTGVCMRYPGLAAAYDALYAAYLTTITNDTTAAKEV